MDHSYFPHHPSLTDPDAKVCMPLALMALSPVEKDWHFTLHTPMYRQPAEQVHPHLSIYRKDVINVRKGVQKEATFSE